MQDQIIFTSTQDWNSSHLNQQLFRFMVLSAALSVSHGLFAQQLPAGSELMVGYYGRPGSSALGVLGEFSIEELVFNLDGHGSPSFSLGKNRKR
jgi:hypothetical protein